MFTGPMNGPARVPSQSVQRLSAPERLADYRKSGMRPRNSRAGRQVDTNAVVGCNLVL